MDHAERLLWPLQLLPGLALGWVGSEADRAATWLGAQAELQGAERRPGGWVASQGMLARVHDLYQGLFPRLHNKSWPISLLEHLVWYFGKRLWAPGERRCERQPVESGALGQLATCSPVLGLHWRHPACNSPLPALPSDPIRVCQGVNPDPTLCRREGSVLASEATACVNPRGQRGMGGPPCPL